MQTENNGKFVFNIHKWTKKNTSGIHIGIYSYINTTSSDLMSTITATKVNILKFLGSTSKTFMSSGVARKIFRKGFLNFSLLTKKIYTEISK